MIRLRWRDAKPHEQAVLVDTPAAPGVPARRKVLQYSYRKEDPIVFSEIAGSVPTPAWSDWIDIPLTFDS